MNPDSVLLPQALSSEDPVHLRREPDNMNQENDALPDKQPLSEVKVDPITDTYSSVKKMNQITDAHVPSQSLSEKYSDNTELRTGTETDRIAPGTMDNENVARSIDPAQEPTESDLSTTKPENDNEKLPTEKNNEELAFAQDIEKEVTSTPKPDKESIDEGREKTPKDATSFLELAAVYLCMDCKYESRGFRGLMQHMKECHNISIKEEIADDPESSPDKNKAQKNSPAVTKNVNKTKPTPGKKTNKRKAKSPVKAKRVNVIESDSDDGILPSEVNNFDYFHMDDSENEIENFEDDQMENSEDDQIDSPSDYEVPIKKGKAKSKTSKRKTSGKTSRKLTKAFHKGSGRKRVSHKIITPSERQQIMSSMKAVGGLYHCPFCRTSSFGDRSGIKQHLKRVHAERKLHCDECDLSFMRPYELRKHKKRKHGVEVKVEANSDDDSQEKVEGNVSENDSKQKIKVKIPKERKPKIKKSEADETGGPSYGCQECEFTTNNRGNLRAHVVRMHTERTLSCSVCDAKFSSRKSLNSHVNSHFSKIPCDICGKIFANKFGLKLHQDTVHYGKPRPPQIPGICDQCGKVCKNKTVLRDHTVKYHLKLTPFKCGKCGKAFSSRHLLRTHERTHFDTKDFICEICSKAFGTKKLLAIHQRIHNPQAERFKCSVCDKTFAVKGALRRHELIHSGLKPYRCVICKQAFNDYSILRRHLKGVHKSDDRSLCRISSEDFPVDPENGDTSYSEADLRYRKTASESSRQDRDDTPSLQERVIEMGKNEAANHVLAESMHMSKNEASSSSQERISVTGNPYYEHHRLESAKNEGLEQINLQNLNPAFAQHMLAKSEGSEHEQVLFLRNNAAFPPHPRLDVARNMSLNQQPVSMPPVNFQNNPMYTHVAVSDVTSYFC